MKVYASAVRARQLNYPWAKCAFDLKMTLVTVCSLDKGHLVSFVRPSVIDVFAIMTARKRLVGSLCKTNATQDVDSPD